MLVSMNRRALLSSLIATVVPITVAAGCKSKPQKQAEAAVADVDNVEKVIAARHVTSLARALPQAAISLSAKLSSDKPDFHNESKAMGASFTELRDKIDDLRSAKRSYFAIADASGEIVWVDDESWTVVGRRLAIGFPAVQEVIDGKPFATGGGKYGGAAEDALTFVEVAPLVRAGVRVGLLVAAWEAHDAAEDLQRQLQTELAMKTVKPKVRAKAKDKYQYALDQPDLWVAMFRGGNLYFAEDAPQPLVDGAKTINLLAKTANGPWNGTFDVMNKGWGAAAKRLPSLGPDVGVAVLRIDP